MQFSDARSSFDLAGGAGAPSREERKLYLEALMRRQWLRAAREEEIRRELYVGTGPEVTRRGGQS
jgi:hypothetical protein